MTSQTLEAAPAARPGRTFGIDKHYLAPILVTIVLLAAIAGAGAFFLSKFLM